MGLDIESLLISALAVIIGIVIHESAHALAAYALGDKTARSRGRVSLNPLNHIDPFGTILLPLLMIAAGGPVFAFAKPVPIYLGNLKHPKRDELLISLAGPASNIVLACLGALLLSGVVNGSVWATAAGSIVAEFALTFIFVNLSLAFFNLIPLPPLDGSSILVPFLKGEALNTYYRIQQYAMPILIVVLYLLPMLTGIDLIDIYFDFTVYPLGDALLSFALA
ncbi:site-2 protease family protein [Collinsella tanakaei]|uniref:site-2 protease family protein n=1 Tax=Collinsella tanakaei TaxID=626935 RepID=UPI0022E2813D|nr:site-2 protease family protein [Collinsella tanakaei]